MIRYAFKYDDGASIQYELDENSYFPEEEDDSYAQWMELDEYRCDVCTLDSTEHKYCPSALAVWPVLKEFNNRVSHEPVQVTVDWLEVQIKVAASTQQAVRSLVGLTLALSRCPVMEKLRPMAHFHLPFGSRRHTQFRALGMYLIGQYLRDSEGLTPDWNLDGLLDTYRDIHHANRKLADRIRAASQKDATVNGLIILDALAQSVELGISQNLRKLKPIFETFLKE